MSKTKKLVFGGVFVAAMGVGGYVGYSAPSADAKLVGDSPAACEQGCMTEGCFCNRSCFITWCWGPYYCQCG